MKSLTVQQLLDICSNYVDLGYTSGPMEPATSNMLDLCQFLYNIIGASHQGCAADEVILTLGDE